MRQLHAFASTGVLIRLHLHASAVQSRQAMPHGRAITLRALVMWSLFAKAIASGNKDQLGFDSTSWPWHRPPLREGSRASKQVNR